MKNLLEQPQFKLKIYFQARIRAEHQRLELTRYDPSKQVLQGSSIGPALIESNATKDANQSNHSEYLFFYFFLRLTRLFKSWSSNLAAKLTYC